MPEVEPITREEKLWSGEDIEPITREEQYIKHIYDKTQKIPSKPITRKEMLLEKAGEGGGSDVTIKQLSVTANGTYSEEGTAYSPVVVNVPTPENAYLLKEASGSLVSFNDGADLPMPSFVCDIDAAQDLHGYDAPWVGGAGKNKLPMTVDGIKANNTTGSWNGNTYTANGVTFKIQTDSNSNVLGITVDTNGGTASADVTFYLSADSNRLFSLSQGTSYILTADGATSNVGVRIGNSTDALVGQAKPNPLTFTADSSNTARIGVNNGLSVSNITIKPMLRLATETDSTFAPYSNICPISGFTEANVVVSPTTDAEDGQTYNIQFKDGDNPLIVYGGTLDVVNGELKVVPYYASYNGETLEGEWISDRDVYAVGTTPTIGAQVVNIGATPTTYPLTPTQVKSLLGTNNVWADTGDITDAEYFSKEV